MHEDPTFPVRVVVQALGCVGQLGVDLDDRAGQRGVDVGHGLGRLDLGHLLPGGDHGAHVGRLDEDHVAQSVLGVVGDADP